MEHWLILSAPAFRQGSSAAIDENNSTSRLLIRLTSLLLLHPLSPPERPRHPQLQSASLLHANARNPVLLLTAQFMIKRDPGILTPPNRFITRWLSTMTELIHHPNNGLNI